MAQLKATYLHRVHGMRKVKAGFSWPAFFFGTLWAAATRMWWPEVPLLLLAEAGLWYLTGVAGASRAPVLVLAGLVATVLYAYVRGRYGNRWLAASLLRRGYVLQGNTHAGA